ncbi:hypothetical protein PILCRDRAFT_815342 [Piloderma croceum F 1598]|uniref:C2 domain-containing protein n=1 Tax=Piloderma croceum (strain F 1598) TaxID=765440 RepID=A0A0C3FS57_PILCF|nr:hypothetical protein PILCRDRAFT_815342 [Piloderma croceum F 1598]
MSTGAPNVPAVASPSATIVVNVKDIKGRNLPNNGLFKRLDKFYVEFAIDGQLKHTKSHTAKGNAASWTESFYFDALGSSVLECRVHTKHKIGSDDFIGGTKDAIDSLLTEGAAGVVTRELCKFDALGNPCKTQTIIELTIVAVPNASDAGVLNMEETVTQQNDVLDSMIPAPSSINQIQEAADTSATGLNNIQSVSATWGPLLQKVKLLSELVDSIAEIHPYAKMAWSILSATHKTIIVQADRDDCIVHLVQVMDDVYSFVKEAEPMKKIESHRRIVALMAQQTTECAYFIRDYAKIKSFWERALKNSFMSNVDVKIKQYEDKFQELKMAFQDRAILQTGITVSRIMDNLERIALDFDLGDMPYAKGARFDPDKGCLPGTREAIIDEITQWVNSPDGDNVCRIFFLSGVAGSGKSAIAHAIAHLFDQQKRLGSSYCFDRADQVNRRPSNLLSTISLNIADLDQNWKTCLYNTIKGNRSLCTTLSVTEQFKNFILDPAKALTTVGPILIVIDAMDESAEEVSRKTLLDVLAKGISDLPSNFRFLITARPEREIVNAFSGNRHIFCKHMNTIDEASNHADITLFVKSQLSGVHSLELEWPNKHWCRMLIESSGGLFQWASTACRAIKETKGGLRPTERLSRFVSSGRGLDELYIEVLHQVFDAEDDTVMSRFRSVMGAILVTRIPLSISTHSELRADDDPADLVELIVQSLGSLLSGVNQPHIPIRALHASFFDFLTDPDRSKSYYVDPFHHHRTLTLSSLRIMKLGLGFNICGLETSHIRNTDVPGLNTRVEKAIAQHLSYACIFWADHLIVTVYDAEILAEIINFFHCRLLYWLECLSLMKRVNVASRMLRLILDWNQYTNDDVASFAKDAAKLVSAFGPAISQSTPHIYLSALSFAPEHSRVAEHYRPLFSKVLNPRRGKANDWPAIVAVMEGHTGWVSSVAFSQDGKHIVSGSHDQTIRVWDSETGDVVLGPLEGHTHGVKSVAFSQDGKRIVSGSNDQTIHVWDSETGDVVIGPLEGHTSSVESVAFSQDGKRIVSGSGDQTIRVWDSETRDVVLGPLEGNTCPVSSAPGSDLGDIFNHNTKLEGGWLVNSSSCLLFWVPSWNRNGLYWPRTLLVIGRDAPPTQLDFRNFVHGYSWHKCKA